MRQASISTLPLFEWSQWSLSNISCLATFLFSQIYTVETVRGGISSYQGTFAILLSPESRTYHWVHSFHFYTIFLFQRRPRHQATTQELL